MSACRTRAHVQTLVAAECQKRYKIFGYKKTHGRILQLSSQHWRSPGCWGTDWNWNNQTKATHTNFLRVQLQARGGITLCTVNRSQRARLRILYGSLKFHVWFWWTGTERPIPQGHRAPGRHAVEEYRLFSGANVRVFHRDQHLSSTLKTVGNTRIRPFDLLPW